jgi:hypothetical protein
VTLYATLAVRYGTGVWKLSVRPLLRRQSSSTPAWRGSTLPGGMLAAILARNYARPGDT